jgi:hypothetical protein
MLLRKLVSSKKEDTMTMELYLKVMKETIDQLEVMQINIPEDLIVLLMLHSMPKEYQYFTRTQTSKEGKAST